MRYNLDYTLNNAIMSVVYTLDSAGDFEILEVYTSSGRQFHPSGTILQQILGYVCDNHNPDGGY